MGSGGGGILKLGDQIGNAATFGLAGKVSDKYGIGLDKMLGTPEQQAAYQNQFNDPMPTRPGYESTMDDKTGLLKSQYNLPDWQNVNPDMAGYEQVKKNALETGPSAWAQAAQTEQDLRTSGAKNSAAQQGASAEAQARSSLASKYGLSPAAQQRLAIQNQRNQMSGMQNIGFQDAAARSNINLNDQQRKDTQLAQLTGLATTNAQLGMQNQQAGLGTKQYNITNALNENQNKNQQNLNAYQAQMQAWAANKQADATRAAGSGGGGGGGKK